MKSTDKEDKGLREEESTDRALVFLPNAPVLVMVLCFAPAAPPPLPEITEPALAPAPCAPIPLVELKNP